MTQNKKTSRRDYAKILGGFVGGAAVASAAWGGYQLSIPAAGPTPTPTPHETNFKDMNIKFIPGGGEGCPFTAVIVKGIGEAENALGCNVDILFSDWNAEKIVDDFRRAITAMPDAIVINANPGYDAIKNLVDEAIGKGISVTNMNNDVPALREQYSGQGFGFVGQMDNIEAGRTLARYAVNKYGIKSPDRAAVWGVWEMPTAAVDRDRGVAEYFEEIGLTVEKPSADMKWWTDPETGISSITSYLLANPDVKVMAGNCFNTMAGVIPGVIDSVGKEPGDIKILTYDLMSTLIDNIEKGYYHVLLDQQQYLQGFLPVVQVCLSKKYAFAGLGIDTSGGIVDESNYQQVKELIDKKYR